MQQASDPCFSAYDCLSISTTSKWTKGPQNSHWQPCRISLSAKSSCFLSLLSLDVFMRGWEFSTMKRMGCELSEWPHRRGVLKVKKRVRMRDGWTRGREKSKKARGGTPAGSQASRLAAPYWLQTSFVKVGKRGSLLHLGMGQKMFCQTLEGVSLGEYGGLLKEE